MNHRCLWFSVSYCLGWVCHNIQECCCSDFLVGNVISNYLLYNFLSIKKWWHHVFKKQIYLIRLECHWPCCLMKETSETEILYDLCWSSYSKLSWLAHIWIALALPNCKLTNMFESILILLTDWKLIFSVHRGQSFWRKDAHLTLVT